MWLDEAVDLSSGDVHAVFKDAVKQKALTILSGLRALEVHQHRVDTVNLLVRFRLVVTDGGNEDEQVGVVVGDFRKQLDEVERPVAPRILLCVGQAVVPRLEFVQQQCGGLGLEHLKEQVDVWQVGFGRSHAFPLALDVRSLGVLDEQDVQRNLYRCW